MGLHPVYVGGAPYLYNMSKIDEFGQIRPNFGQNNMCFNPIKLTWYKMAGTTSKLEWYKISKPS